MSHNLEKILEQKGLTEADLARRLKVSRQYINQICSGKRYPTIEMVEKIESFLQLERGALAELFPPQRRHIRHAVELNDMEGVELAYLGTTMQALREGRQVVLRQKCDDALRPARGKSDTRFFDFAPEDVIVSRIRKFDGRCSVFTEEKTVPELKDYASQLCYFIDPFDRSKPFAEALKAAQPKSKYIADALEDPKWPLRGLDAPFASITCVRNSKICFNVMLDYTTGEIYVACKAMLKHGSIEKCSTPEVLAQTGKDIRFNKREGRRPITFVGDINSDKRPHYEQHLADLGFRDELPPQGYQDPGGPARILYLSDDLCVPCGQKDMFLPALIMSNGEKICEWFGWLAYATHSPQLNVYEIRAEKFASRGEILLAPPPQYSMFSVDDKGCSLMLNRITVLNTPVFYRSALVITHSESADANIWMRALTNEHCRMLQLRTSDEKLMRRTIAEEHI
jgi:transcriptional regulator with XRE-family HTH domain